MKKQVYPFRGEQGQAMVLIVLAIVGMFGFAALSIDMGQIYSARRAAQSAADAAAMAAAFDMTAGSQVRATAINKAITMAAGNGFTGDNVRTWVEVNNPPVDGPYCSTCVAQSEQYFQVKITVKLSPIFAHFVYGGSEQTTVEAVSRAEVSGTITATDAIVSLSTTSDSLNFSGNTGVEITGGNARTAGGMVKNGASGNITITSGGAFYATTFSGHTSPFSPAPQKGPAPSISNFTPPYCPSASDLTTWTTVNGIKTKTIGGVNYYYYSSGLSIESLPSGVHCIQGGIGKGNYTGTGVLVVLLSGELKQTGNDSIDWRAASNLIDANGNQFGGMVFYGSSAVTGDLVFGGNSGAYFEGTIFAPKAHCDLGGTSDGRAHHTSVVCDTIKFHGNPTLKIDFRPAELFKLPPQVSLVQ